MNFLVLLLLVPLFGAFVCALSQPDRKGGRSSAATIALMFSLATLGVGILAAMAFFRLQAVDANGGTRLDYVGGTVAFLRGFSFHLGIDAISLWLILLTVGLMPLAIAASFDSIRERQNEYYAWMLALLVAMNGVFLARDVLLFYVFFELTLIPMFFIIGIWGGPNRRPAAGKFFLFTFAGSVFMLAALVFVGVRANSFDIDAMVAGAQNALSERERFWVFMGFLAGFAVKVPLFPVHTWLPLAHTEAPTAGSVILAGVLLKLGTYGLLRLAVPIGLVTASGHSAFPLVSYWIAVTCVVGIIYGALVAWVQQDIKKLVAYSSVSHLGFCVLGLVALNDIGFQGSVLYMINHGICTGALFLCIGMIYDRYHTRDINELSGLARRMPVLAFFFILFVMGSIGLPGTNGFVSEFLTILAAFTSDHLGSPGHGPWFGAFAATGIVLGAIYMLHMTARIIWGPLKTPGGHGNEAGHAAGHEQGHGHAVAAVAGHGAARSYGTTADASAVSASTQGAAKVYSTHAETHVGHAAHGQASEGQGAGAGHGRADAHGDINGREIAILLPLALAVLILGVKPGIVMDSMLGPIQKIRMAANAPGGPASPAALAPIRAVSLGVGTSPANPETISLAAPAAPTTTMPAAVNVQNESVAALPTTLPATEPSPASTAGVPTTSPVIEPTTAPATLPAVEPETAPATLPTTVPTTAPATLPDTAPAESRSAQ